MVGFTYIYIICNGSLILNFNRICRNLLKSGSNNLILHFDNAPEKLEAIVAEKNTLLLQIIALEKNRNQQLNVAGFSSDAEGMSNLLKSQSDKSNIDAEWTKLLELSATAKENNRTNGILINRQMTRNQASLNILQQNDPSAAVYGADGQSRTNSNSGRGIVAG